MLRIEPRYTSFTHSGFRRRRLRPDSEIRACALRLPVGFAPTLAVACRSTCTDFVALSATVARTRVLSMRAGRILAFAFRIRSFARVFVHRGNERAQMWLRFYAQRPPPVRLPEHSVARFCRTIASNVGKRGNIDRNAYDGLDLIRSFGAIQNSRRTDETRTTE